jgi:hypothetical protein
MPWKLVSWVEVRPAGFRLELRTFPFAVLSETFG